MSESIKKVNQNLNLVIRNASIHCNDNNLTLIFGRYFTCCRLYQYLNNWVCNGFCIFDGPINASWSKVLVAMRTEAVLEPLRLRLSVIHILHDLFLHDVMM